MKFNFKIQQYQTDAVDAVVKVFQGQGYHDKISYIRDLGKKQENQQMRLNVDTEDAALISKWRPEPVRPMCISRLCSN